MADLNQEPLGEYKGVPYYASGSGLRCRLGGISSEYPSLPKLKRVVTEHLKKAAHDWHPSYSKWRHGGWYVDNLHYPSGACGCVSNNYPDKKWRIACDGRRTDLGVPGDHTFPSRDAAARAEREIILGLAA